MHYREATLNINQMLRSPALSVSSKCIGTCRTSTSNSNAASNNPQPQIFSLLHSVRERGHHQMHTFQYIFETINKYCFMACVYWVSTHGPHNKQGSYAYALIPQTSSLHIMQWRFDHEGFFQESVIIQVQKW